MGNLKANIRNNSVVLITMVILAFLLCFYFFFYVSGRDVQIRDRNFRVLNKVAENIVLRSSDYYRRFTPYREETKKIVSGYVQNKSKITNRNFIDSITGYITFVQNAYVDTVNQVTGKPYNYPNFLWFPLRNIYEDSVTRKKYALNLGVDAEVFFSPLLKREEFSDYIIVHDTQVVYKTIRDGADINKFDSLFTKNSVFTTSSIKSTQIAGRKYVLFTVQYRFRDQKDWALIGLIPESTFNKEKYSVPETFLFFVLFCMLFVFIALPLIKSILMHPNERMKTFDILATYFSFLMGFALLVFIFLYVFNTLGPGKVELDKRQKSLSKGIIKSFMQDLQSNCKQLAAYDSMVEHFPFNSVNLTKESFLFVNEAHAYCPKGYSDSTISKPFYPYFSNVFWLDSEGVDTIRWTTDASLPPKNNFTDRDYFKNIKNDATWKLPGSGSKSFYLQPVHSWSDGQFKGVVSTRSEAVLPSYKIVVAGFSSRFPSVINPVLPLGYSFCIIDEKGDVLFHSDIEKSTNENFKDESNNNTKLVSAMYSRTETFFDEYYSGKDCRMLISPIKGLPFYLVTIRNTGYSTAFNIQVFVFTTILFFVLVLFGLIHFFMIALFSRRKTVLKSKLLNMNWVWPNPDFESIYLKTVLLNIITFCGSLAFCFFSNSFFSILCMFYNVFFTIASFFTACEIKKNKDKGMSLKLNIYLGLMFILVNWAAFHIMNCSQIVYPLIYMFFYCLAMLVIYKAGDSRGSFRKLKERLSYEKSYSLMIVTWLMLAAFLPVFLFYRLSYNHETQNLVKYSQLEIAKKINSFTDKKSSDYYPYFILHDTAGVGIENIYTEPFRTTVGDAGDSLQVIFSNDTSSCTSDEEFFVDLIQKTRIIYNTISLHEDQLINVSDRDTLNYHWIKVNDTTLVFKTTDYNNSNQGRGDALFMKTYLPVFNAPPFFQFAGFNFWLLFFIMLACFYYMIKYFISRLFLINYFSARDSLPSENFLPGYNAATKSFDGNTRIILAGLVQSGKKQYVMNLIYGDDQSIENDDTIKVKKNNFQKHVEIDLRNISDTTIWEKEKNKIKIAEDPQNGNDFNILLINYFEYNLSDAAATLKKLAFIEEQTKKDKCIIILTSIHPIIFLNFEKKEIAGTALSKTISEIDYYKWISLFSEFFLVHFPLTKFELNKNSGILETEAEALKNETATVYSMEEMEKREDIIIFITGECDHGRFLYRIGKDLIQYIRDSGLIPEKEEVILKIQQLAHSYYLSIWNSFSRNEQYMLYDFAEDGFANYKNRNALSLLFNNGIIINHDRPQLMNQSFKNFILSEVKSGNVVLNDEERAEGSSWKKFKMPFMLVIITVLFFVFYTQEDSFNQILAFVASFTAAIPIILRIFTILPSSKGDKEA